MDWARILAYVTGTVAQDEQARTEYLAAKNPFGQKTRTTGSPAPKRGKHSGAGDSPVRFCGRFMMPSPSLGMAGGVYGLDAYPAYVTGTVDQELLARNEYLAAENRIMKA